MRRYSVLGKTIKTTPRRSPWAPQPIPCARDISMPAWPSPSGPVSSWFPVWGARAPSPAGTSRPCVSAPPPCCCSRCGCCAGPGSASICARWSWPLPGAAATGCWSMRVSSSPRRPTAPCCCPACCLSWWPWWPGSFSANGPPPSAGRGW